MPAEAPATRRVTPESAAALVAVYAARWGLTGRRAPAADWTFTVEVVPGLTHQGGDAWAVVDPKVNAGGGPFPGGSAHVRVRDIDTTPIPNFDGDPMLEIRVTLAHEAGHCVVAEAVAATGGALTVPAEEQIVETAAQAIVRSEGTPDARVMARAVSGLPSTLRARISASAGLRARGGEMDPKMLAALALEGGALTTLEGLPPEAAAWIKKAVELMSGGAPTAKEPDGDEAAKVEPASVPGGASGGAAAMDARRGKEGDPMDQDKARARKAAAEAEADAADIKAMAAFARPAQKEALVTGLRARLGDAFKPVSEKRIMDAPTFVKAKEIADLIEETIGEATGTERARSGIEHEANLGPATRTALPTVEILRAEGFTESWLTGYAGALRSGPDVATAYLGQGRASARARTAQNGGK